MTMYRLLCLIGMIMWCGVVTPLLAADEASSAVLSADKLVFNFGTHDTTETINHTFSVKNATGSPVTIGDIKVSCGCTRAKISPQTIPAGEAAEVTMVLDLWGMRGWVRKPIILMSDGKPVLSLAMQGTVTRKLEILPEQLNLGEVERDNTEERLIMVVASADKAIRVTNATATTPAVKCTVESLVEGKVYAIKVGLKPEPGAMEVQDRIRILLDYPDNPVIEVPVTAKIVNEIDVLPMRLVIGGAGNDASPRYIVFRKRAEDAFDLRTNGNESNVSLEIQKASDGYRVKVTPKTKWGDVHEKQLVFVTSVAGMKEIKIPITVADLSKE